ncbi:hypothetical protein ACO1O0_006773 [Amphichorda felina]
MRCCSPFGFCGTSEEHCGEGCLSTCDFKLGCDANKPCADGTCCSKFGFCGLGEDFCSPENCVAGCDAKSQCDPGTYGADFVELDKCPLNVCCSKWGYCGATAEFCGDKKVKRPSCPVNGDQPVSRVVGYYEGWAARRSCQAFMPEDVPLGVYTHLNFAFAGIDPVSYKIVPAQAEDVSLYSRLTKLKELDSALKVYIAIGGWTFNDPGRTFHTFSKLAADEAKQRVFFKSLISFMNTYNFDGVDIDWEYPVDKDRGGTGADYANFPRFMQNLKAALDASSGGRNGISVTVPVSFWYLQHFDIVELEKWVDFFNVMSYDLHGLWDKGNKWLGAYLNSHTNMTEITEYLDLFWRNDIQPEKITLGLAFYSRTFLAADKGCTMAQCMFDAVGEAGPCSRDDIGGTLTNAEVMDQIRAAGVTPSLDDKAMVKTAVVGRKWITYDDEDTFKLKVDAARGMCLGGVMVWAVSQDYTDNGAAKLAPALDGAAEKRVVGSGLFKTRFSAQLQSATGYKSAKAVTVKREGLGDYEEPSPNIVRDQCYWSNCGAGCSSGYTTVPRLDKDGRKGELMQDGYQCQGGRLRHFCCPDSKTIPRCGWYDFFNGKCGKHGQCPAGSEKVVAPSDQQREIGSTQAACNNGKAQLACCQTETDSGTSLNSMLGYDMCKWQGKMNDECSATTTLGTGVDTCEIADTERPFLQILATWGSAATYCRYKTKDDLYFYHVDLRRPLCCKAPEEDLQWRSCATVPARRKDNFCEPYCPDGKIRIGMGEPGSECKGGGSAICCEPRFLTEANNAYEEYEGYFSALKNVLNNPGQCDWDELNDEANFSKRGYLSSAECEAALMGTLIMLGSSNLGIQQKYTNSWNRAVEENGMYGVTASTVSEVAMDYGFSTAPSGSMETVIAESVLDVAKALSKDGWTRSKCPDEWLWDAQVELDEDDMDPDSGGSEIIESVTSTSSAGIDLRRRRDHLKLSLPFTTDKVPQEKEDHEDQASFESPLDSSSEPNSTSYHKSSDWHAAIESLQRLSLGDEHKKSADNKTHARHHGDGRRCEERLFCRAKMQGFDLSVRKDRMAYQTFLAKEYEGKPKRFADVVEFRNRLKQEGPLEERDSALQLGNARKYTIKSQRTPGWIPEIIESSPYPNGNQGDDLIRINNDASRYVVKSLGCMPEDYGLLTRAGKSEVNGIWVSEHILELNTIGRFMTASLDGIIGDESDDDNFEFPTMIPEPREVRMFMGLLPEWSLHTAISPADSCLAQLGSLQETTGLVICDSRLNWIKTKIYNFQNPIGEVRWTDECTSTSHKSLMGAMGYIQSVMGVFDYYDDDNVKARHRRVYNLVMEEMASFESAYDANFGTHIYGHWQQRWHLYMNALLSRVTHRARGWTLDKLHDLWITWAMARDTDCVLDPNWCTYIMQALSLIEEYRVAIEEQTKMIFDTTIFENPLIQDDDAL